MLTYISSCSNDASGSCCSSKFTAGSTMAMSAVISLETHKILKSILMKLKQFTIVHETLVYTCFTFQ